MKTLTIEVEDALHKYILPEFIVVSSLSVARAWKTLQ